MNSEASEQLGLGKVCLKFRTEKIQRCRSLVSVFITLEHVMLAVSLSVDDAREAQVA